MYCIFPFESCTNIFVVSTLNFVRNLIQHSLHLLSFSKILYFCIYLFLFTAIFNIFFFSYFRLVNPLELLASCVSGNKIFDIIKFNWQTSGAKMLKCRCFHFVWLVVSRHGNVNNNVKQYLCKCVCVCKSVSCGNFACCHSDLTYK